MSALIQGKIKIIMHCASRDALTVTTWPVLVEPGHSGTVHIRASKTHVQKRLFHGLIVEHRESSSTVSAIAIFTARVSLFSGSHDP